jgi:F-type H+-transporting ATPase subunit delta
VFDTSGLQIARVYADSFYAVAQKANQVDALLEEYCSLVDDLLAKIPQLAALFASAVIARRDKAVAIRRTFEGRASPTMLNFLLVLNDHGRLPLVPVIGRALQELHRKKTGQIAVDVRSAVPLDDELQQQLRERLARQRGVRPELRLAVDPGLLGGVVIRVGDMVYDGSVRTKLARLRERIVERSKHEIQSRRDQFGTAT